jgi:tyrosine-protein kinase Etk/Wzc
MEEKDNVQQEADVSVLDFLIVILKHKRLVWGITLSVVAMTVLISFLMTPMYRAETKILPPQQNTSGIASEFLSQFSGGGLGLVGGALGLKNPNDTYVGMLKSRTIGDRIIDRFKLMEIYGAEYMTDARNELDELLDVESDKEGIITVSVEDEDPARAAAMANAFVEELRDLTQNLAVTEASQRRLFFEEQLKKAKGDLIRAEDAMKGFQEKTGAMQIDEQAKAVIDVIAQMRALIAAKEVELKVMRTYATSANPDLQRTEDELAGMKEQLQRMEKGGGKNPDPLMSTGRMPAVGADYRRKLRDLKYYETLFDLMAKQYEIAKVDEARNATVIQVLDMAVPPEKKARPKRALMAILGTFTGFFFAVFAAFFAEFVERSRTDAGNREKLDALRRNAKFR